MKKLKALEKAEQAKLKNQEQGGNTLKKSAKNNVKQHDGKRMLRNLLILRCRWVRKRRCRSKWLRSIIQMLLRSRSSPTKCDWCPTYRTCPYNNYTGCNHTMEENVGI